MDFRGKDYQDISQALDQVDFDDYDDATDLIVDFS